MDKVKLPKRSGMRHQSSHYMTLTLWRPRRRRRRVHGVLVSRKALFRLAEM